MVRHEYKGYRRKSAALGAQGLMILVVLVAAVAVNSSKPVTE